MTSELPSATKARTEPTADGSLTLGWDSSHVTYRSRYGAWTEANHVFVEGTDALASPSPHIFEFGLGAATNLFATLQAFLAAGNSSTLIYETLESSPLPLETFGEVVDSYPISDSLKSVGLQALKQALENETEVGLQLANQKTLRFILHRRQGLPELGAETFTAVYFDPFGPRDNPDAWTDDVFERIAKAMKPEGRLATYAAASEPRRRMSRAGLHIARRLGAGGKREMTIASKSLECLQDFTIWPKKLR